MLSIIETDTTLSEREMIRDLVHVRLCEKKCFRDQGNKFSCFVSVLEEKESH